MILRAAVPQATVDDLLAAADRLVAGRRGGLPHGIAPHPSFYDDHEHTIRIRRLMLEAREFDALIDWPPVLQVLHMALGPVPRLLGSELFDRGPCSATLSTMHTDGGPGLQRRNLLHPEVALQLKVQYFLTPQPAPGFGNLVYLPGSHRWSCEPSQTCEISEVQPELTTTIGRDRPVGMPGAKVLLAEPGDVVVFTARLWHGVMPNTSSTHRRSVILRYGPAWTRPYDYTESDLARVEGMAHGARTLVHPPGGGGTTDWYDGSIVNASHRGTATS